MYALNIISQRLSIEIKQLVADGNNNEVSSKYGKLYI